VRIRWPALRYAAVLGAAVLVAATRGAGPPVAWPQVVLFHGPLLPAPVALAGVENTMQLMSSLVVERGLRSALAERRGYDVAVFWSPSLRGCAQNSRCYARLRPDDAGEHAVYYPRRGELPAVIRWTRRANGSFLQVTRIEDAGLAILAEHGIPTDQ
jgi:hypothetical protein